MLLDLANISKTYTTTGSKSVRAVDEVSLSLGGGEFVAVQGPSGCGKSTLLLTAGGLLRPESGVILIGGENPYEITAEARARFRATQIGFVFQQFHLVPYLSVFENILAPTLAAETDNAHARAEQLLEQFGLTARKDHVPGELSSGERQRTALARALLNQPKLLLADEPTGNLDPENAKIVLDALESFRADGGGVLLVTHDQSAAERAGRVVRMEQGRIASASE